jgi:hypothetical protein
MFLVDLPGSPDDRASRPQFVWMWATFLDGFKHRKLGDRPARREGLECTRAFAIVVTEELRPFSWLLKFHREVFKFETASGMSSGIFLQNRIACASRQTAFHLPQFLFADMRAKRDIIRLTGVNRSERFSQSGVPTFPSVLSKCRKPAFFSQRYLELNP